MSYLVFRPLAAWTDPVTTSRRSHPFDSGWEPTLDLLRGEVDRVNRRSVDAEIVLQVQASERDVRRDGMLRADARVQDDGVVISFESMHGPLRYACDTFTGRGWGRSLAGWQANVRAIALALEALRKVDRYGVGGRGEQYTGWAQLGTGVPMGPGVTTVTKEQAIDVLGGFRVHSTEFGSSWWHDREVVDVLYKRGAKRLHPDAGGDAEAFKRLGMARNLLANL